MVVILVCNHNSKCGYTTVSGDTASVGKDSLVSELYCDIIYHIILYIFNPFPNKPWFLSVCSMSLLKTLWEKEKLLETSNFSSSNSVFYLLGELSVIFIKFEIVICKHFVFGRV